VTARRRVAFGVASVLAGGCNQILGVQSITLGDGGTVPKDTQKATMCITGSLITPCFVELPSMDVSLGGVIDTDTDSRCSVQSQDGGPDVCVIGGKDLTVSQPLTPRGMRPLVLVAVDDLEVDATIDIRGNATNAPAGSNTGVCTGTGAGQGGGGGGGGSFGAASGGGGGGGGGTGGGGAGARALAFVRGGCNGAAAGSSAAGGVSGGALYMLGGASVTVSGSGGVLASGAGGAGGTVGANGGGGGGAGGLVGLDAPSVTIDGDVIAEGGGGGGAGGASQTGTTGAIGDTSGAAGGSGASAGGNGGYGANAATDGATGGASAGGGGGGGSVGVIWMNYTEAFVDGTVSPDATEPM